MEDERPLTCVECSTVATGQETIRWHAYQVPPDEEQDEPAAAVVAYCPGCAAREFGEVGETHE